MVSSSPPPCSFIRAIFHLVFDSRSSFYVPKPHGNACYAVYELLWTPGGALPYMGHIGMCRSEGYGFQVVYSRIRYINQSVWV